MSLPHKTNLKIRIRINFLHILWESKDIQKNALKIAIWNVRIVSVIVIFLAQWPIWQRT
jgi:hypothetical protein